MTHIKNDKSNSLIIFITTEVETMWKFNYITPNPNVFPYNEPDSDNLARWYVGTRGNVNIFAYWVIH